MISTKRPIYVLLSVVCLGLLAACTKGTSDIQNIGSLSGFSVDQSKVSGTSFRLTGACSQQYQNVEISTDNGQTWSKAQTLSPNFSLGCSSGGGFSGDFQFPTLYQSFLIHGTGDLGSSDNFVVAMGALVPQRQQTISAGAAAMSGTGFKLSGSITHESHAVPLTGGSYKLKGILTGP